jgi:hypothetical protein
VTRRGIPAVVVVSVAEFERLKQRAVVEAASFTDHLLAMPQDDLSFERARAKPRPVGL